MTTTCQPTLTPDIDMSALREKYRVEADKRRRPEGFAQYIEMNEELEEFLEFETYEPMPERAPLADKMDVVVLGGGFAGLIAAGRLKQAGVGNIRIIDRSGDFGEPYGPGYDAFYVLIREWREQGNFEGLAFEPQEQDA